MLSNRWAFGLLSVACVAAAGGGAYLATRQSAAPVTQATPASVPATPSTASPAPAPTVAPVLPAPDIPGTEGIVQEEDTQLVKARTAAKASILRSPEPTPKRPVSAAMAAPAKPASRSAAASGGLDRTWPAETAATDPPPAAPAADRPISQEPPSFQAPPPPPPPPVPPAKEYEELTVPSESVLGLQLETPLSSERSRVEDPVEARVSRDVRVASRVAIPAGTNVLGSVTLVEKGGKFKERARLGVRFHTLVLGDGTRLSLNTDTVFREGPVVGNDSAAKIGGATIGGAILGAILGGARGAVIGGTTGAGAGTAVVAAGDRKAATFPAGANLTVRVQSPVVVTIEKNE